jgi:hypothetical protein
LRRGWQLEGIVRERKQPGGGRVLGTKLFCPQDSDSPFGRPRLRLLL